MLIAVNAAFIASLFVIAVIDIKHQIIPNRLIIVLMGIAAIRQVIVPELPFLGAIYGAAIGFVLLLVLAMLTKGGIGGGDVKLMLPLGFYFGPDGVLQLLVLTFILGDIACGLALAFRLKGRKDAIPYAPFMALATLIMGLAG